MPHSGSIIIKTGYSTVSCQDQRRVNSNDESSLAHKVIIAKFVPYVILQIIMGFSSRSKQGMHQRSDVVERCVNIVEWCTPLQESSRDASRNRCFENRLGWNDIIIGGLRDMDKGGKLPTIQLLQVTGSIKNITIFQNSTTRKSGASTVRQHHNSLLHKQFGRTQSSYDPVDEGDIYPCT